MRRTARSRWSLSRLALHALGAGRRRQVARGRELQLGDETAGAILLRDAGGGTAQVDLDYVTPRFRDFTPGEFVFRRSGLLRAQGFTRVLTPPGMVDPYYASVGFTPLDDRYVLDLR